MKQKIFLDNTLIARPPEEVGAEAVPYLSELWGNPTAPYENLLPEMAGAYQKITKRLGASEGDHFVFTSSGAEAVAQVVNSVYRELTIPKGKNHFLTSKTGEAPAIMSLHALEKLHCTYDMIDVDKGGRITVDSLIDYLTPRTALLTLSWGNGMLGTIQEIEGIAKVCKERGIFFHLDVTHVIGKMDFSFAELDVDAISFEGSVLHAPQGTGGVLSKKGLAPLIAGGGEQAGFRAGPFFVGGLMALGKAFEVVTDTKDLLCLEGARLRSKLEAGIREKIPDVTVYFENEERLPHISVIGFPGVANEALLFNLRHKGVAASVGGGRYQQIGLLLGACGYQETNAISFSLSYQTTDEEIEEAIQRIVEEYLALRKLSAWMVR